MYLLDGKGCKQGRAEYVWNIQLSAKRDTFPCAVVIREYPQ
jgi:hypothetical protein